MPKRQTYELSNTLPSGSISVMKVAHHGSRYSTGEEWLQYWKPLSAVASAGASNSYGHPHPDVLSRLAQAETGVWRTDRDGEVRFKVTESGLFMQ
ncbi:MAG: ComEC/Rec2 family competence protein [Bacillota bacterium]